LEKRGDGGGTSHLLLVSEQSKEAGSKAAAQNTRLLPEAWTFIVFTAQESNQVISALCLITEQFREKQIQLMRHKARLQKLHPLGSSPQAPSTVGHHHCCSTAQQGR